MSTSAPSASTPSTPHVEPERPGPEPRPRDVRLRRDLLGVEPHRAAGGEVHRADAPEQQPEGAARRDAGARRLARPHPGRCAHRPLRRPRHVPGADAAHRALRAPRRTGRQPRVLPADAALRLLPRHRWHDVRGRRALRQRVVPRRPARLRHRRLRRRHGRHGPVVGPDATDGDVVRLHADARHHRRPARRDGRALLVRHAQLTGLEAQHRPGRAQGSRRR